MTPGTVRAVMPIKPAGTGKSRLAALLDEPERAMLARCMAVDVIAALRACPLVAEIAILGAGDTALTLAGEFGCRLLADDATGNLCANLDRAAGILAAEGATTLLIVPADQPTLTPADIGHLLAAHAGGVTVAVAARDGGTNALVLTPPQAIGCLFGPDSAARHLAAAQARGLAARVLDPPAFARDIDTVDDVRWLCTRGPREPGGATLDYLQRSGICARFAPRGTPDP
jgi:2-phospho-L-lactate guanylyltransferase